MENIQKSADVRIPFLDNWKKNQNSIVKLNSKFREKTFLKHILFNRKNILSYVCIRNLSYLITIYLKPYSIYSNSHLCKRKYI